MRTPRVILSRKTLPRGVFFLAPKKITTFLAGGYFEIVLATIFVASVFALFAMLVIIVAI